jgi:nucleoside-diphosphate-sugar epimerase
MQSIVFGYGFTAHGPAPLTETTRSAGLPATGTTRCSLLFPQRNRRSSTIRTSTVWRFATGSSTVATSTAANRAALERGCPDRAYNIVDDTPVSWRDYVRTVADVTGAANPLTVPRWMLRLVAPYAAGFATEVSFRLSNARARKELGWAPRFTDCRAGIRAALNHRGTRGG